MSAAGKPPILSMTDVTKVYKAGGSLLGQSGGRVIALDRISLDIQAGEIYGLVGESGSGKTTASRLIVGLESPNGGQIQFDGQNVVGLKGRARREFAKQVQVIFQDPYQSLNAHLSIFDTVCEPLVIHGIGNRSERRAQVCEALDTAGLTPPEDYLNRYPHQLSGGQRQRVAIARAMVLRPRFLIADEPTSMLDASISFQIFRLLHRLRETAGVTMLFITHSLAAARNLCDRVGVIYRGRLVEQGTARETIMHPRHPYTKALLDAHPRFIEKIVINMGMGRAAGQPSLMDAAIDDLTVISGQKPVVTKARKSIAGFKIRDGWPIGCKVTLRRERMYEFLERLIAIGLPRVRDFRGTSPSAFDGRGNYTLGVRDILIFPEVDYQKIEGTLGMNITITTTAPTDDQAKALLAGLGMPFRQR